MKFETLEETHARAYASYARQLSDSIDPRVWTHCKIVVVSPTREEMWCDGVMRGFFEIQYKSPFHVTFTMGEE